MIDIAPKVFQSENFVEKTTTLDEVLTLQTNNSTKSSN